MNTISRICQHCSAPFTFKRRGGSPQIFCSVKCRMANYIKRRHHVERRPRLENFCRHGHRRTVKNTYVEPNNTRRICKLCRSVNKLNYMKRKKERAGSMAADVNS